MAFKDKHDVWSKEEHSRYEDEPIEGLGWSGWIIFTVFVLPWLFGLGLLVAWVFDL